MSVKALRILSLIAAMAASLAAMATDIVCEAGRLAALVGADAATITELRLSGSANAADLTFMAEEMPALRVLDMTTLAIDEIPAGAFASTSLEAVNMPISAKRVGLGAFAACKNLQSAILSPSAVYEGYTFRDCTALEWVKLNGCTEVSPWQFAGCAALQTVEGTENLVEIGANAFAYCEALTDISFGENLKEIGRASFMRSGLKHADLSKTSLDSIPSLAFSSGYMLNTIVLPAETSSLGDYAMAMTAGLENIEAQQLRSVPALGADTWAGVAVPAVNLYVDPSMVDTFKSAPEWQDFNILVGSGVAEIIADSRLSCSLEGGIITITSPDAEIASLQLYDASGVLLKSAEVSARSCKTDISDLDSTKIIIVAAKLTDGRLAAFKLAK